MRKLLSIVLAVIASQSAATAQAKGDLPDNVDPTNRFAFYLHGGVVSVLGDNAINSAAPEWGPYQYSAILDSLKSRGFVVISEIRSSDISDSLFAEKLASQVRTLLEKQVPRENIIIIGASAGNDIVLRASSLLREKILHYVIMGGCWKDTYKSYQSMDVAGKFLSIIEQTDPHGTCSAIFSTRKNISIKEITLNTGLSHGFIYRGYAAWIDPIIKWYNAK